MVADGHVLPPDKHADVLGNNNNDEDHEQSSAAAIITNNDPPLLQAPPVPHDDKNTAAMEDESDDKNGNEDQREEPVDDIQEYTIYNYSGYSMKKYGKIRDILNSPHVENDKKMEMIQWTETTGHYAGYNSFLRACFNRPPLNIIQLLFQYGGGKALILMKNNFNETPLHLACTRVASFDVVKFLVDEGGKELIIRMQDNHGNTALHAWCRDDRGASIDVMKLLIDEGGKELIMMKDNDGNTALHALCGSYKVTIDVVKLLIDEGGEELIMMQNKNGDTALHTLCEDDWGASIDVVKLLIQEVWEYLIMVQNKNGDTALHVSCKHYKGATFDVTNCLVDEGGGELIMVPNNDGDTVLHTLCGNIDKHQNAPQKRIRMLLEKCSDTDKLRQAKTKEGLTALDLAKQNNASSAITHLLTAGYNFDIALEQQHKTVGYDDNPKNANDDLGYKHHAEALVEVVESMEKSPDAGNITIGL